MSRLLAVSRRSVPAPGEVDAMAYYECRDVLRALPLRLRALREVIPRGSNLLDLGCNDGRIARALQESGHVHRVVGVDLERAPSYQGAEFLERDLREGDLDGLPDADVVLFLNVAHHLLLQGSGFVRDFLTRLLQRYPVVLLDMGSLSEGVDTPWRVLMGRLWPSDPHMWKDLFVAARWRRPLLNYSFQGGRRVLWKLVGSREPSYQYEQLECRRRNEACHPHKKRLLPGEDPGGYEGVVFRKLRRKGSEELFWAKQPRLWRDSPCRHRFEDEVEAVVRQLPVLASLSLERHAEWGRIYPYLPELHDGLVVHYPMRHQFLTSSQCQEAERVAGAMAPAGPLANIPLGLLTDFQCSPTSFGMFFLDWEPDHQKPRVEALLAGEESARRELQEMLYDPRQTGAALERALHGAVHPYFRMTGQERQRLATDLLRRAQFLRRAGDWRWARVNYLAAMRLGPPALRSWLALLRWHLRRKAVKQIQRLFPRARPGHGSLIVGKKGEDVL